MIPVDEPGASGGSIGDDEAAFLAEAKRLHERYTVEVIERYDVCPWARHVRAAAQIDRFVLPQRDLALEPSLAVIDALEADPRQLPVAIAIYPRLGLDYRQFDAFAGRLREADQKRHGGKPIYVSASFHPDYPLNPSTPSSLVTFLRRSPDPSLQLVRLSVIEEARGKNHGKVVFDFSAAAWEELRRRAQNPSVTDRIAADNFARVEREGTSLFEAIFRDLAEDRERSYARFAKLP